VSLPLRIKLRQACTHQIDSARDAGDIIFRRRAQPRYSRATRSSAASAMCTPSPSRCRKHRAHAVGKTVLSGADAGAAHPRAVMAGGVRRGLDRAWERGAFSRQALSRSNVPSGRPAFALFRQQTVRPRRRARLRSSLHPGAAEDLRRRCRDKSAAVAAIMAATRTTMIPLPNGARVWLATPFGPMLGAVMYWSDPHVREGS
jgi:hypothetical protein